jgi:hypothetical protein
MTVAAKIKQKEMTMKKIFSGGLALALVALLGMSGIPLAGPWRGHHPGANMTPEQYAASGEVWNEFNQKIQPLHRQMLAKQAELDALYYNSVPQNDPKAQGLMKEVNDLDAKLSALHGEMRSKMNERGVPYGYGMGCGHGCSQAGSGHGRWDGYNGMRGCP